MIRFRYLALILVLLSSTFAASRVYAQQTKQGSGISISPLHNRYNLDPGQATSLTINLKNITAGPIVAKGFINDFKSDNVTGNPVIITDPNKKLPSSIKDFITNLPDVPLAAGEQQ